MARLLTTTEKKELKNWAKENDLNLSYNKSLEFGNGFWVNNEVSTLKATLLNLNSDMDFQRKAIDAVGFDYVAYDTVAHLGNEKGFELIGYNGKETFIKSTSMIYVNGFLAIPKKLF